jgi:hypothetical protein
MQTASVATPSLTSCHDPFRRLAMTTSPKRGKPWCPGMRFHWLVFIVFLPMLGLSFLALGQGELPSNHQVRVFGTSTSASSNSYSFWVDADHLPSKVSWEPGKQFPVSLDTVVGEAGRYLWDHARVTNPVSVAWMQLLRISVPPVGSSQEDKRPPEYKSDWIIALRFEEHSEHASASDPPWVVRLLDGSYASQTVKAKSSLEWKALDHSPARPPGFQATPVPADQESPRRGPTPKPTVSDLVSRPEFVIPQVQWNPDTPFPLDIGAAVTTAYNCLVLTNGMPGACSLQVILIARYLPLEAVHATGADLLHHLRHWRLGFGFGRGDGGDEYWVHMLLDGRILCVTSPER